MFAETELGLYTKVFQSEMFDLMVSLEETFKVHQIDPAAVHPDGSVNVWSNCTGCWDISLKTTYIDMLSIQENSVQLYSHKNSSSEDYECMYKTERQLI